jgi:prepilin-type N-terminal cleavage/methylation domain-containing protein
MRRLNGFSIVEMLIVVAIIAIIAAIAVPSFMRANVHRHTEPFKQQFGLDLAPYAKLGAPPDQWLDADQRRIIRPMVDARLAELCADPLVKVPPVLLLAPATDAFSVAERLQALQRERANVVPSPERCRTAKDTAAMFGFLDAEAAP